jgi:filamentous hemagglutinin family protein
MRWFSGSVVLLLIDPALALPIPDNSLPVNSVVNTTGNNSSITGGTVRGGNVFHSFEKFDIDAGTQADFVSPNSAIANILVRVTGGSQSNILGTLSTSGVSKPNLFLINPHGILFGSQARLQVQGSFVATTASAIAFDQQGFFDAKVPNNPVLTVNPSALLFNQIAAPIINQPGTRLSVPSTHSLLMVGGHVNFDRINLTSVDGKIELAGVTTGMVGLSDNLSLNLQDVEKGDVSLIDSTVNATGGVAISGRNIDLQVSNLNGGARGGDIALLATQQINMAGSTVNNNVVPGAIGNSGGIVMQADRLLLTDSTLSSISLGQGNAGKISVHGNTVSLKNSFITTAPDEIIGFGDAGDINVVTNSLFLRQSRLSTASVKGFAGNISIDARNTISVDQSQISSQTFGIRDGGDINIKAGQLNLTNGGVILSATTGQGNAGNININPVDAFSSITITGVNPDITQAFSSGLLTSTDAVTDSGRSGNINVNTGRLRIADAGVLSARTRNSASGGNILVKASNLELIDGGQILTSSFGTGRAGDITVNATDIKISGIDTSYNERLQKSGSLIVDNDGAASGLLARVQGEAAAGNIQVTSPFIYLDNQGLISTTTTSGQGGNISLDNLDLLLLRGGSQISTTAGTASKGGDGGNINIDATMGFIIAANNQNNDITANAFSGQGGKITIKAATIFGLNPLSRQDLAKLRPNDLNPSQLQTNDITAISQINPDLSGVLEINAPEIDPTRTSVELPTIAIQSPVAQGCQAPVAKNQSSFIMTGRGGLPLNPRSEVLDSEAIQVDWVAFNPTYAVNGFLNRVKLPTSKQQEIVEANGWVVNSKGEVVLTATPQAAMHYTWQQATQCQSNT